MKMLLFAIISVLISSTVSAQIGELIWEENFDSLENWIIDTGNGDWGWGNGELQFYSSQNVSITEIPGEAGNNAVKITAKNESGSSIVDKWGNPLDFTSGKINSKSKVTIHYGMVETRIKVPDLETGGWPAFWLLGTSNFGWPRKGELDLMEMGHTQASRDDRDSYNGGNDQNNSTENNMTGANAIFFTESAIVPGNPSGAASLAWDGSYARPYFNMDNPLNDRFLKYRMYWDSTSIRFTVIDEDKNVNNEIDLFITAFDLSEESNEFLKPFYFIINLAIGGTLTDAYNLGNRGSGENVSMPMPAEMLVDYVKVYKWNNQGSVHIGPPTNVDLNYGLFTDSTHVSEHILIDEEAFIYVWEETLVESDIRPYEGEGVLSWKSNGKGWFGAGIMSEQPINLSEAGHLNFRIKIPANIAFQIGVIDAWGNQNYVEFPANQTKFGLTRDGEWGQASIPIGVLRGQYIDMRMLSYEFVILEVNGVNIEFALDDIYYDGLAGLNVENVELYSVQNFQLYDNYPNPFNPTTTISYNLYNSTNIKIEIYNTLGQRISELVNLNQQAGFHRTSFDASGLPSGIYIYKISTPYYSESKKMILVK
tara:strand:+ start:6375 stop:8156 length:1782 start_codon:yes stop_codon:yes gene_type:complete